MRRSAIDAVGEFGVADDSVYVNLEKTYDTSFVNTSTDYDNIQKTLNTLAVVKTDEAVKLLSSFLQGLNTRRRIGPWAQKERIVFEWVISSIAATKTRDANVRLLLTTIQRNGDYTSYEQSLAAEALRAMN